MPVTQDDDYFSVPPKKVSTFDCLPEGELESLRAENERLRELLCWLDRKGGLGLDVHDRIQAELKTKG